MYMYYICFLFHWFHWIWHNIANITWSFRPYAVHEIVSPRSNMEYSPKSYVYYPFLKLAYCSQTHVLFGNAFFGKQNIFFLNMCEEVFFSKCLTFSKY